MTSSAPSFSAADLRTMIEDQCSTLSAAGREGDAEFMRARLAEAEDSEPALLDLLDFLDGHIDEFVVA